MFRLLCGLAACLNPDQAGARHDTVECTIGFFNICKPFADED